MTRIIGIILVGFVVFNFGVALAQEQSIEEKLREAVKEHILEKEPEWREVRIEVEFKYATRQFKSLAELSGEPTFEVLVPPGIKPLGNLVVPVRVYAPDFQKKIYLNTKVRVFREVVKIARKLKKEDVIAPEDVELVEQDLAELPKNVFFDIEEVVSLEATSSLPKGTLLLSWMVQRVPAVRRGREVIIVARYGDVLVSAKGISLGDGLVGDPVSVRNTSSRREVEGRVVESGLVEVKIINVTDRLQSKIASFESYGSEY